MQLKPRIWLILTVGLALVFGLLGVLFIFLPAPASAIFGIGATAEAELAYVRALGIRDLALSFAILLLLPLSRGATRRLLAASALIPAGDIALVLWQTGLSALGPLLLHAASGAVLLALALLGPRDTSHSPR
jgi:hypothetical protein